MQATHLRALVIEILSEIDDEDLYEIIMPIVPTLLTKVRRPSEPPPGPNGPTKAPPRATGGRGYPDLVLRVCREAPGPIRKTEIFARAHAIDPRIKDSNVSACLSRLTAEGKLRRLGPAKKRSGTYLAVR
jgi:hypothetical protein